MAEIFSFGGRGCFLYFAWKESLLYNEKISATVLRERAEGTGWQPVRSNRNDKIIPMAPENGGKMAVGEI